MPKTLIGVNEDGSPRFRYDFPDHDPDQHALINTGPISGSVEVEDGASYDVSDGWIMVPKHHAAQILVAIHRKHHAEGRYEDVPVPTVEEMQAHLDASATPER